MARDCRLHDAVPSRPIWEQYPCLVSVTKRVVKGETRKVMAHKGYFRAFSGNHALFRAQQRSERAWARFFPKGMPNPKPIAPNKELVIHHFKWRSNVREKLEARVQKYKAAGASTWIESARILQHLNQTRGRLDLDGCESNKLVVPPALAFKSRLCQSPSVIEFDFNPLPPKQLQQQVLVRRAGTQPYPVPWSTPVPIRRES